MTVETPRVQNVARHRKRADVKHVFAVGATIAEARSA
jgi:hypothetical protein